LNKTTNITAYINICQVTSMHRDIPYLFEEKNTQQIILKVLLFLIILDLPNKDRRNSKKVNFIGHYFEHEPRLIKQQKITGKQTHFYF